MREVDILLADFSLQVFMWLYGLKALNLLITLESRLWNFQA